MKKTKNLIQPLICISIYLFLSIFINLVLKQFINTTNFLLLNIVNLITPAIICIILLILNIQNIKGIFKDFKKNIKTYLIIMLKNYFLGVILMITFNLLLTFFLKTTPINESLNREIITKLPIYAIISILVFAPINEELVFRASFKNLFTKEWTFSLISSIVFGLSHVIFNDDFIFLIPYAALSYFFAKSYYRTNNIMVSITMHSFHNLLCLILIFIGGNL